MENLNYLFAAYTIIWAIVFGYVFYMQRKQREISQTFLDTLLAVARALEARGSNEAGGSNCCGHTERVRNTAKAIGVEMGLERDLLTGLEIGALLHDICKIGVDGDFSHKSAPLDDSEYSELKKHPQKGKRFLEGISFLKKVIRLAEYHQDRRIGYGSTARFKQSDVTLIGRILAVAEVFDALVSKGAERNGLPVEEALIEIEEQSGALLDPDVVKALGRLCREGEIPNPPSRSD